VRLPLDFKEKYSRFLRDLDDLSWDVCYLGINPIMGRRFKGEVLQQDKKRVCFTEGTKVSNPG
jgi:hypothetical protein